MNDFYIDGKFAKEIGLGLLRRFPPVENDSEQPKRKRTHHKLNAAQIAALPREKPLTHPWNRGYRNHKRVVAAAKGQP